MDAMIRTLDLDLLRAFVAVVETGGFSAAGQRLLRGQSAVSLQIKRLEEQLGMQLLNRNPRHLALTADGEVILTYARRMLLLNDELIARVDEPEISGLVRLGAPEDFATSHLPKVLARFARTHPKVRLEITCELTLHVLDRFNAGGLDIALIKRAPETGIAGKRIWREPLVWAAANHAAVPMEGPLALATSPRPCVYRQRATEALDGIGRPWHVAYTCGSLAGILAAVRAGLGVTVLPKEMVPLGITILDDAGLNLPDLPDTEMALLEAPSPSIAAERLADVIMREITLI
jgi:DNA-binding transcriptional LysR family regulator